MGILLESALSQPERSSAAGQEPRESRECFPAPPQPRGSGAPAAGPFALSKAGISICLCQPLEPGEGLRQGGGGGSRAEGERLLLFGVSVEMHFRPALAAKSQMNP